MGVKIKKTLCKKVMRGVGSGGPEGPSRRLKATSPPQELEVGTRRAPYLLVYIYLFYHPNIHLRMVYFFTLDILVKPSVCVSELYKICQFFLPPLRLVTLRWTLGVGWPCKS